MLVGFLFIPPVADLLGQAPPTLVGLAVASSAIPASSSSISLSSSTIASVERTRKPRPVSYFWQKMHLKGHPRVVKM